MKTADIQAGGIADLEQLEMNDILQNAFKMALEHPQELLSNLELEPSIQVPPLTSTRPIPPRRPKFASPKPTAGPSFKSYPRSAPVVTTPRPQPPKAYGNYSKTTCHQTFCSHGRSTEKTIIIVKSCRNFSINNCH